MTQTELFQVHQSPHGTSYESRLAHGQEIQTGIISRPPMPAPASFSDHIPDTGKKVLPPFARNSNTSREAAVEKYKRGDARSQRERIFEFIRKSADTGATRTEIHYALDLEGDTIRPRVKELLGEAKGFTTTRIRRNGETRLTKSGLNAEVLTVI